MSNPSTVGADTGEGADQVQQERRVLPEPPVPDLAGDPDLHAVSFGPFPADKVAGRINETVWRGHPTEFFGPPGDKPWSNYEVFFLWDSFRACQYGLTLIFTIVSYFASTVETDMFNFSLFGGGGDGGAEEVADEEGGGAIGAILAVVTQVLKWSLLFDVLTVFITFYAIAGEKCQYSMMYNLWARIHRKWHKGNPPFVPVDTRSGVVQSLSVTLIIVLNTAVTRLLEMIGGANKTDRLVMSMPSMALFAWYVGFASARRHCMIRCWYMLMVAQDKKPPPPAKWNGIKVIAISYSSHGPRVEYRDDKVRVVPPGADGMFYYSDQKTGNKPTSFKVGIPLAIFLVPGLSMLITWHFSWMCVVMPFLTVIVHMLVVAPFSVAMGTKAGKYSEEMGTPFFTMEEWLAEQELRSQGSEGTTVVV